MMDYNNSDIIIARATPIGKSALAVIRVSGENLDDLLSHFFPKKLFVPQLASLQKIKKLNTNIVLDTCIILYYKNPKSFTGEDMLEISCHGNDLNVEQIINEFIKLGIRLAYPGEFSYRAFKNSKIDLIQAESIAAKITCNSNQYGVALQNLENGSTSNKLQKLRKNIINMQAIIEHELDFNENEITHLNKKEIQKKFRELYQEIQKIIDWSLYLQVLDSGYKVSIIGPPNVGKSTLFNRIAGSDKAIVTPIKGTTRDVLEASIQMEGVPFKFYDTAGYRVTKNKIESMGIEKTINISKKSDIILMLDSKEPREKFNLLLEKNQILKTKTVLFVKTKCDKKTEKNKKELHISCKNDLGIDQLLTKILTIISVNSQKNNSNSAALCNKRQISLLEQSNKILDEIINNLNNNVEMDIVASQTKGVVNLIEELLGKITSTEVLNNIFKGFCVGK